MKKFIHLPAAIAAIALMSSCSNMNQTASTYSDDVYSSPGDYAANKKPVYQENNNQQQQHSAPQDFSSNNNQQQQFQGQNMDGYSQNNNGSGQQAQQTSQAFNYDDYYDYEYATRMKRFYHPVEDYGYYDNYYTNSYWYSGVPAQWGMSVYMGYPWWGPSYYYYNYYPSWYWYD